MIPTERNLPGSSSLGGDTRGSDDEAEIASDVQRLETSIQWLKHERMLAALEAGLRAQSHKRRLACAIEQSSRQRSVVRPPEVSARARLAAPQVEVAFSPARRPPSTVQKRSHFYSLGFLWAVTILFGSAVAMLVGYRAVSGGWPSALVLETRASSDVVAGEN